MQTCFLGMKLKTALFTDQIFFINNFLFTSDENEWNGKLLKNPSIFVSNWNEENWQMKKKIEAWQFLFFISRHVFKFSFLIWIFEEKKIIKKSLAIACRHRRHQRRDCRRCRCRRHQRRDCRRHRRRHSRRCHCRCRCCIDGDWK